ncbi:MAG: hypothetical protein HFJ33_05680 [Clostridia bacterium]|nr:hypothetical protein [Clostridia bacterium]
MYERSAIVLERYMEKVLKLNKEYNLKRNNENYNELINEIENYQNVTEKELEVIQEFDDTAKEIENLQKEQEKLYKANKELEEERAQLFTELGEEAEVLDIKLKKIENLMDKNNEKLKEIRSEFIKNLTDFSKKQKNRNKCEKARRIGEANHIGYLERMHTEFDELDVKDIVGLKDFINFEKEQVKQEALQIMIKNGKSERVPFNQEVLKRAIKVRIDIAEKEAECYISVYDKMKKLLAEPDSEVIRLNKYKKTLRDTSVKLAFLKAEREYIVGFLDYERMTAISGTRAHKKMMMEACNNFELDIMQIEKLYELILRETNNRSTKKGYNQLYNKTYLKNIEDKEKNFEQEVNNVNISMGTVINSNYWRIEGIKNIYNVFQEEVSKKFNRDLSEYKVEDLEEKEELAELVATPKQKKENVERQLKYNGRSKYNKYNLVEQEENYEEENEEYEEEYEEKEDKSSYQYRIDDYNYNEEDDEEEYEEEYDEDDEYDYEEDYEEENDDYEEEDEIEEEEYDEEDEYEENYENNYDEESEEEIYEEENFENETYQQENSSYSSYNAEEDLEEESEYEEDYEDDYDEEEEEDNLFGRYGKYRARRENNSEDEYRAYNENNYLDDDDDEEYENIYQYNYEDDEAEYMKQKLRNKTVISFDDEESIDMIIANSRKKSTNRRNNNKGLFNKLFKK